VTALIVAAGKGTRVGGGLPKQYRTIAGVGILRRSLERVLGHADVDCVRVVISAGHEALYEEAVSGIGSDRLGSPITGGMERQESVRLGLEALAAATTPPDLVLIHDAARPFLPHDTISRVLNALKTSPAALPVLPVVDTLKRVSDGSMSETVPRADLMRAQTPQGFWFPNILAAHRCAVEHALIVTDDAEIAERAGLSVALVTGSEDAMKITTEDDFDRAERLFARSLETRVGTGFDVHRLGPGSGVVLGGVTIPFDQALQGHSDADVALHAITDAILGAIGDGDIGAHFPPSDPKWKGASSDRFLADAVRRVTDRGGVIRHLDVTILCERPKIGPHRDALRASIAEICGVTVDRVSVKATTTERLGFTGRGEGIAAQAAATIAVPVPRP
jgi:2-C-methyl-D-erythritol 4-phosphate cytidylyltransferase/2-C-methyl-D-erythritol 2,4-cyclodiphosphate synthase